jgi:carbonic anhydrase
VCHLHRAELDVIDNPEARHRQLVEINGIEQCVNLFKTGIVQPRRVETFNDETFTFSQPRTHAVVCDPKDGKLRQLQVDFKERLKDVDGTCNLCQTGTVKEKTNSIVKQKQFEHSGPIIKQNSLNSGREGVWHG